jgi:mycoredoxin
MTDLPEITLYGATWCGSSRRVRQLLDSHSIPYRWVDIDLDDEGARKVALLNHGNRSVPTLVWADGSTLVEPSNEALAEKLKISL